MGEIFERTNPASALAWTGERLTTDVTGQVEIEHLHRYFLARTLCRDMDVLDIASGEGYGAALLAQVARSVVGIDVSAEAVAHAKAAYTSPRLRFIEGDARRIELEDASVDVVVSFETIEHFFEHEAFIAEVRRVLRPGGSLIISSPERDVYSPADQPPNPYHVKELSRSEFAALLAGSFQYVTMCAQRPLLGSAIVPEEPQVGAGPFVTFERRGDRHFECSTGLPRALYLLAIASDTKRLGSSGSLYVETGNIETIFAQTRRTAQLGQDAESWRQQLIQCREELETLGGEQAKIIAEYDRKESDREAMLREREEKIRQLTSRAAESEQRLRQALVQAETVPKLTSRASESEQEFRQALVHAETARQLIIAESDRKESDHQAMLREREEKIRQLTSRAAESEQHFRQALVQAETVRQLTLRVTDSEQRLDQVFRSTSWRLTGPLRGFVTRHPVITTRLRGFLARNPALRHLAVRILRGLRRRPRATPMLAHAPQAGNGPTKPKCTPKVAAGRSGERLTVEPKFWIFLGDTIDWLQAHAQLTGVGRVTTELFFASLSVTRSSRMLPCALAGNEIGLEPISLQDSVTSLAPRAGTRTVSELLATINGAGALSPAAGSPSPDDHILFTGVVWTPSYEALFQRLTQRGVRFSVLIYDIIPIESPEFVTEAHSRMFTQWLGTTLALTSAVFVTSQWNKDQILRWAVLSSVLVPPEINIIDFGFTDHGLVLSDQELAASDAISRVRLDAFVLCVGTIDRRKNQALLCRLWQRLTADLGRKQVPQLVLVGRNELDLASLSEDVGALFKASDIVVLEGLGDAALAGLYRHCMLTAFPSLAEGYGLPVAESLGSGKLCISSDLPVIREHAGDLPWYFRPGDEEAAYAMLRRAIDDPDARAHAEARIAREYQAKSWKSSYLSMAETIAQFAARPHRDWPGQETRPFIPGVAAAPVLAALDAAQKWCTDLDPEVSILVINWNASQLTRECIRQIWANTAGIRYEIIIVDNGSDATDLEALRSLGSGVRLLPLGTNRYFGEANNIAAEHAKGRYICLLNNDAFVQPGWLRHLVECLENDPDAGAAGPLFLFPDGTIQEAGASIDAEGFPVRFGRGQSLAAREFLLPQSVDYISAATLVMPRDLFLAAGGFDPTYEPAYYEDVDLCLKLRSLGRKTHYCPEARVIHIEGSSANDSPIAEARRRTLGDLNRGKFVSRWGPYLRSRADADLRTMAKPGFSPTVDQPSRTGRRKTAALFTPYPLTPGGGERFLLTVASALAQDCDVTIVTSYPYSRLRLLTIGREFGIDLSGCQLQTEAEFQKAPDPDLLASMGNHLLPPIPARSKDSVFICQFPFPLGDAVVEDTLPSMGGYRAFVVYSEYVRAHVLAGFSGYRMPPRPVEVVYPPAPQHAGSADRKQNLILSVGRFFAGGHNKRHDLMIVAFKSLLERTDCGLELHLAGSSVPDPVHMDYLESLKHMAVGLPIAFHVNAPQEMLSDLYRDAAVYWHATGLEADLSLRPELAEHFGISIVEAMSAECVPVAYGAGGPLEIITHGTDGFLYHSVEELVSTSADLFRTGSFALRSSVGKAAGRRAAAFSPNLFMTRIRNVLNVGYALENVDSE